MFAIVPVLSAIWLSFSVYSTSSKHKNLFVASVAFFSSPAAKLSLMQFTMVFLFLSCKFFIYFLFGNLRAIEKDHIYEGSWMVIIDSLFALSMFRSEMDLRLLITFCVLLAVKIFHWICSDRIDYMEQRNAQPWLYHAKLCLLLFILILTDLTVVGYAYERTMTSGASCWLQFAFEHMICLVSLLSSTVKYSMYLHEVNRGEIENKSVLLMYVDLARGNFVI